MGGDLFIKEIYPDTPFLNYLEWYTNAYNSDLDFNKEKTLSLDNLCEIRIKNSSKLVGMMSCDHGITPTYWQLEQYPKEFHDKISVIHEGVCTNYFHPDPEARLIIPEINLDLSHVKELLMQLLEWNPIEDLTSLWKLLQLSRSAGQIVI